MSTPVDTIEPPPPIDQRPTEPRATESSLVLDLLNFLLGALLVETGLLDKLWLAIEPPMHWRTGPPAQETLIYIALIALGWLVFNLLLALLIRIARSVVGLLTRSLRSQCAPQLHPRSTIHPLRFTLLLRAGRFIVSAAIVIVIQVLMLPLWPLVAAMLLLPAFLLSQSEAPCPRRLLHWAWCAGGIALAGLLIYPGFLTDPRFIPRLALILTAWRIAGKLPPLNFRQPQIWTPDWAM